MSGPGIGLLGGVQHTLGGCMMEDTDKGAPDDLVEGIAWEGTYSSFEDVSCTLGFEARKESEQANCSEQQFAYESDGLPNVDAEDNQGAGIADTGRNSDQ